MTIDLEKQHDENQQTAIWPGQDSNEGHVYVALGVPQLKIDTWMKRDLELAQQDRSYECRNGWTY